MAAISSPFALGTFAEDVAIEMHRTALPQRFGIELTQGFNQTHTFVGNEKPSPAVISRNLCSLTPNAMRIETFRTSSAHVLFRTIPSR
jgi:hypothetical protein